MWIVVFMAQTKEIADKMQQILEDAGLLVKIRPLSVKSEDTESCFEVLVPESEVAEAHDVIIEKGM